MPPFTVSKMKRGRRSCQCVDEELNGCPFHTVGHPYQPGCCDQKRDAHRHPTDAEYDSLYPVVFDEHVSVGGRRYRVDARRYAEGVGVTLTRLFPGDDGEAGLCFDIPVEALRVVLPLLQRACWSC